MDHQRKNELYEKAKQKGMSQQEVDALLNFSYIMASKIVKKFLIEFVEWKAKQDGLLAMDKKEAKKAGGRTRERYEAFKKLISKLYKIKANDFVGYATYGFNDAEGNEHTIHQQLSIVPKDYEIFITIEGNYMGTIIGYLDKFVDISKQYYLEIVRRDGILSDLAILCDDVDVSSLKVNQYNRTMYLDEEYDNRIGILCFYVDKEGKPIERTISEREKLDKGEHQDGASAKNN